MFIQADRDPEVARVLFESPAESMSALLTYLSTEYGGTLSYLRERARLGDEVIADLRSALIETE
jgi:protein-tyrosine phosphatase